MRARVSQGGYLGVGVRRVLGARAVAPSFWAPLNDLGAGAVNLALNLGGGAATFSRASVAWTKLASGLWVQVASGQARSTYLGFDTAVGSYAGYYSEIVGTQLVTPTASIRDMTDASWVSTTMTAAKTSTGIDGVATSCSRLTAAGATSTLLQTLVAAASSRTYSCWVKRVTGTGTVLLKSGAATLDITALINSVTFTRVSLTDSTLNTSYGIQINVNADAIDVDFNQFEAGASATSPMASAGAARGAESLSYPSAGNVNTAAGTAYAECSFGNLAVANRLPISDAGGASNAMNVISSTSIRIADSTTNHDFAVPAISLNTIVKVATTWGSSENAFLNGVPGTPVGQSFDGSMDWAGAISLGSAAGLTGGGSIRNAKLWTMELTPAQVAVL